MSTSEQIIILIACLLALLFFAFSVDPADAHVVTRKQCRSYASIRSVVVSPRAPRGVRRAYRACKRAARLHAERAHCVGRVVPTILCVFGAYGVQAVTVARCESGLDVNAANGQFLGLYQMGERERSTYGHGPTPLAQSTAAHQYFVATGRDWGPWQCKPL